MDFHTKLPQKNVLQSWSEIVTTAGKSGIIRVAISNVKNFK